MSALARGPDPLRLCLAAPSLPEHLVDVRARMAEWAHDVGLATDTVDDIVLATHEALANVADHAYPDGGGDAELDAICTASEVCIVVRDHGNWQGPAVNPGWRGHGLVIIHGLADRVDVDRADSGTRVAMHWRLSGPR
ncbi:MAG: ATP-binding protein [Actinomycetes bacterium]